MADTTTVTIEMTLEQFYPTEPDAPPAILLSRSSLTPSGGRRPVSMKVFVRDDDLYRRLRAENCEGDTIRATTETHWDALDRGPTLTAFEPAIKPHQPASASIPAHGAGARRPR